MKKPAATRSKARPTAVRARAAKTAAVTAPASALAAEGAAPAKKKRTNPVQFFNEVSAERRKISWPSRKETWVTSVMVAIMVVVTAGFFFVVDLGLSAGISGILRLAAPAQ